MKRVESSKQPGWEAVHRNETLKSKVTEQHREQRPIDSQMIGKKTSRPE